MTDIEIAKQFKLKKINLIAKSLNINSDSLELYGNYKAKLNLELKNKNAGKLILVTSINPTKFGEGKTTVSIGLADSLNYLNYKTILALREPSLGPVFGIKGGATGGGYSQVAPMEDINLHFTGDFHAITTANNLLSAMIDNSIYFDNPLNLDPNKINFHRCMDMNDRALRNMNLNVENKYVRGESFNITSASEMMGIVTMAQDIEDLKDRINNICVGFNKSGKPVFARELNSSDAMAIVLKDAIKPNLVQTLYKTPAIIHAGPFANISHGCNSILATKTALSLGEFAVTEAGFGADLGAQKFYDLICPKGNFNPYATVLVVTIRAIKLNGGEEENLQNGLKIVEKHINNLTKIYNQNLIVAINLFPDDDKNDVDFVKNYIEKMGIKVATCSPYTVGQKGCLELAKIIVDSNFKEKKLKHSYDENDSIEEKINKIACSVYGAKRVFYSETAKKKLKEISSFNPFKNLPVIIAKTQYSLSDDSKKIGVVSDFDFTITDFDINSGAGYIVAKAGKMMLMPGLSRTPNATNMFISKDEIRGIF